MKQTTRIPRSRILCKVLPALGIMAVTLAIATTTAEAHRRHNPRDNHRNHHRHKVVRHVPAHRPPVVRHGDFRFQVPRLIHTVRMARLYDPYLHGRVYHAGHGHYHTIYRFPVSTRHGVVYRPHAYCDGRFHATGSFTVSGPVFSVQVGF